MIFSDLPFQPNTKAKLIGLFSSNRVPHAILLNASEGSGHFQLGLCFASLLMCSNPKNEACGNCPSCKKIENFQHPDLHFSFPIHISKSEHCETSDDQRARFVEMLNKYKCIGKNTWYYTMGNENKQGVIGVKESQAILKKLSLKAFEGRSKVLIMWLPEMMNQQASNKLLKLIEEPPEKTFFILVSNNKQQLLPTISSRLQSIDIPSLQNKDVVSFLMKNFEIDEKIAFEYAKISNGNLNKAINHYINESSSSILLPIFIKWMRLCYSRNIAETIDWVNEISKTGREQVKDFLLYVLEMFRKCVLGHYKIDLEGLNNEEKSFLEKFKPFINHQNIEQLNELINEAHFHMQRNANTKILLLDVSIKLYKLIKNNAYQSKTN